MQVAAANATGQPLLAPPIQQFVVPQFQQTHPQHFQQQGYPQMVRFVNFVLLTILKRLKFD